MSPRLTLHRVLLLAMLLLFAAFFLTPLYVMLSTSLKTMDEVRNGTLLSLPASANFSAWPRPGRRPAPAPIAVACSPSS